MQQEPRQKKSVKNFEKKKYNQTIIFGVKKIIKSADRADQTF